MRWHWLLIAGVLASPLALGQTAAEGSANTSWSSTTQQSDAQGATNPTRTKTTHSEINGRIVDRTSIERLGPDGQYVPYSEIERESVKVNETTTRTVERTFGRGADGQRILVQERQAESRELTGGAKKSVVTTSNPDADGQLQVVQREETNSNQSGLGVQRTSTTIYSQDGSGSLAPTVHIEMQSRQTDKTTTEYKKSTSLADGAGNWTLSEIREGTTRADAGGVESKEERVLKPGLDGKLELVERTVSKGTKSADGSDRETTETYSKDVPGVVGNNGLSLVRRDSKVAFKNSAGKQTTTRTVEGANPGNPESGLRVTQQAIDIVRPGANGVAQTQSTINAPDVNGDNHTVWVDTGKMDNVPTVTVDTSNKKSETKKQK